MWRIPVDGGEAEQLTKLPLDVKNLLLSRDGRHVAFTMGSSPAKASKARGGSSTKPQNEKHRARP